MANIALVSLTVPVPIIDSDLTKKVICWRLSSQRGREVLNSR